MHKINVILLGKTGSGKSTLINAVLGEEMAKVGVGSPITQKNTMYTSSKIEWLTLFDTKGFELGDFHYAQSNLAALIRHNKDKKSEDRIHLCWYCINDTGKRYENEEINLIRYLMQYLPVIVVMTQTISDNNFYNAFYQDNHDMVNNNIVQILAKEYVMRGNNVISPFGIDKLLSVTITALLPWKLYRIYGLKTQMLIDSIVKIKTPVDKENAISEVIKIMGNISPEQMDYYSFKHRLWDHLIIMSDFQLSKYSPYPIPDIGYYCSKPKPMQDRRITQPPPFGKIVELLIAKYKSSDDLNCKNKLKKVIITQIKKVYAFKKNSMIDDAGAFLIFEELLSKSNFYPILKNNI